MEIKVNYKEQELNVDKKEEIMIDTNLLDIIISKGIDFVSSFFF